jgi:hypothetical protein
MARKKPARGVETAAAPEVVRKKSSHLVAILILAAAVLVFQWEPLFGSKASIQWDAVDVHYSSQKYFSDHIRAGELPYWTPYIFSGFPFLADPQVGAFYPLNWPFFVLGITPGAVQAELALHMSIAAVGMYLFAWGKLRRVEPALVAAMAYAFSGFFAGHASHVGIFQAASWLPWILMTLDAAAEGGARYPAAALSAGMLTGVMALAGHFQTALYAGFAAAVYSLWLLAEDRSRWKRVIVTLAACAVVGVLIAAVMVVPGIELLGQSVREGASFRGAAATNAALVGSALGTLVYPNLFGVMSGEYKGPADMTQYYFYAGLLLLPLAVLGVMDKRLRWAGVALIIPAIWYGFGPAGGFYRVVSYLPGFGNVRAPVHIWFVAALGLALLAAAGAARAMDRWKMKWLAWAIPAVLFCDLFWFNSATNPLAYARASFAELYGDRLSQFEQRLSSQLPPLMRFHAPEALPAFGPLNHPLDAKAETTYGYNPLRLTSYNDYLGAAGTNPKLLAELGAKFRLNASQGVEAVEDVLPRVTIPKSVVTVENEGQAGRALTSLDPREGAIVVGRKIASQDAGGSAIATAHGEGWYRIRYKVGSETLLRVAETWYPGWEARAGGRELEVVPVDRALMGVVIPAGEGEIELRFRPRRFGFGAGVSILSAGTVTGLLLWFLRRNRSPA